MRLEGRHGFVKTPRPEDSAGEATAELKRECFSVCGELTDQRRREEELLAAFAVARVLAAFAVARVLARRKLPHETFMEYKKALRRAGESYVIPEPYYVVAFINGVGSEQLTHLLQESKPEDLDAAAKEAILLQRSDGARPSLLAEQRKRPGGAAAATARRGHEQPRKRPRRDSGSCFLCHQFGHFARECPDRWDDP